MIKINLLGKKQAASGPVPFGLDEKFQKLGVSTKDFKELQPGLVRVAVLLGALYAGNYVPTYIHETKKQELDTELNKLNEQAANLSRELASKKDIRKQMEQLTKEEVELQRQLNAVSALQRDRSLAFRTLDSLVVFLPQKVWLNNIEYRERAVTLKGACWEYFPINDFVKSINESIQYTGVNFKGINAEIPATLVQGVPEAIQKIKNFELEFRVKGAGET